MSARFTAAEYGKLRAQAGRTVIRMSTFHVSASEYFDVKPVLSISPSGTDYYWGLDHENGGTPVRTLHKFKQEAHPLTGT